MSGVAAGVLGIAGCNGLSTQLQVLEHLPLNVHSGQKFLAPGNYNGKLEVRNEKKVTKLRIEVSVSGKKNNPVIFIPLVAGQSLPTHSGELHIPAAQSGQVFDLHTIVDSDVTETAEKWAAEDCTREGRITECRRDENGVRSCTTRSNTLHGTREVRGYDRITLTDYDISLTSPADSHVIAAARAHDTKSVRIETFRGDCRVVGDLDVYIDHGGPVRTPEDRWQQEERDRRDRDRRRDERRRDDDGRRDDGRRDREPRSVALE